MNIRHLVGESHENMYKNSKVIRFLTKNIHQIVDNKNKVIVHN